MKKLFPSQRHGETGHRRRRILAIALLTLLSSWHLAKGQDISAQWLNGTGNWNDPTQWSTNPIFPNNGGGLTYAATASAGTLTLNQNVEVDQFTLSYSAPTTTPPAKPPPNVTLQGANTLTVDSGFAWNTGSITGSGTINSLGTTTISGTGNYVDGWILNTYGVTTLSGSLGVNSGATINNQAGATLNMADGSFLGGSSYSTSTLANSGTLNVNAPTTGATLGVTNVTNNGTVNVTSGTLKLNAPTSNLGAINVNGGTINVGATLTNSGTVNVASGSTLLFQSVSNVFNPGSSITGAGTVNFQSGTTTINGAYNLTGSTTFTGATVTFGPATTFATTSVTFQNGTINFNGTTNINQTKTLLSGGVVVNLAGNVQSLGNSIELNGSIATLNVNVPMTFDSMKLTAGSLAGSANTTVAHSFEWNSNFMAGTGTTIALSGVLFNTSTTELGSLNRSLVLYGSSSVQANPLYSPSLDFEANAALTIAPGATFNAANLMISGSDIAGATWGTFTNHGALIVSGPGSGQSLSLLGTYFVSDGSIAITNGALHFYPTGTSAAANQNGGSLTLNNGYLVTGAAPYNLNAGSLTGNGTISGRLFSNGLLSPSGGNLVFTNARLTLGSSSDLAFTLGGNQAGVGYDQIFNTYTASLDGDLDISFANGFEASVSPTDTFTLLTSNSTLSGQFANVASGGRLETDDGLGTFQVDYSGNSVVLSNYQALPEPSGGLLVLFGSYIFGLARRRR